MKNCSNCKKTIQTENGEMSVDMCKILGACTCSHNKDSVKNTA